MARATKTRNERSLDGVLGEVEALKKRRAELADWLADARRRFQPQALSEPEKYSPPQVAAAKEAAAYIGECEDGIRQCDERIAQAWQLASGLSDGGDRLAGTDAEIEAQIVALTERQRRLQSLAGRHREDQHDRVDLFVSERRALIENLLASPLGATEIEQLAGLWAWRAESFLAALHEGVDALPADTFAAGPRSSWQAEVSTVGRQIERRRKELALRESEREAAEAVARKAEAEVALAAVGADDEPGDGDDAR